MSVSDKGDSKVMNCYFCKSVTHNPQKVAMYDGRTVLSCHSCRRMVADAKPFLDHNDNSILRIMGGAQKD